MDTKELAAVEMLQREMRERMSRQNDDDMVSSDLTGLYTEIIGEVLESDMGNPLAIYDYAKLLGRELLCYSGHKAYIAGNAAKNQPENEVLRNYMAETTGGAEYRRLESDILVMYNRIADSLGGKRGLIAEFTEAYRSIHGTVKNGLLEFIRLGQAA